MRCGSSAATTGPCVTSVMAKAIESHAGDGPDAHTLAKDEPAQEHADGRHDVGDKRCADAPGGGNE